MPSSRRKLEVAEHSTLSAVSLDSDEADLLRSSGARLEVVARGDGRFDIRAKQIVGTIRTRELDLVIRPKVDLDGFLDLVWHALGLVRFGGHVKVGSWDGLLPALSAIFARALAAGLRRGLLRGYRELSHPLSLVRGRIDAIALARRFGVVPPIDCVFQEFTPDVEVNQRLRAAAEFLLRAGFADPHSEGLLRSAIGRLSDVSRRRFAPPVPPLPKERRFAQYGVAIGLADLILNASSLDLRSGTTSSLGLLVNMDDLYEAWVAEALRSRVSARRWERHPGSLYFDHDRYVKLEPDILWTEDGRFRIPIDAKYKRGPRVPNVDVYQMASYCAALGASEGVLFCVGVSPYTIRLRNGVCLHVRRLDVSGGPVQRQNALISETLFLRSLASTIPEPAVPA